MQYAEFYNFLRQPPVLRLTKLAKLNFAIRTIDFFYRCNYYDRWKYLTEKACTQNYFIILENSTKVNPV